MKKSVILFLSLLIIAGCATAKPLIEKPEPEPKYEWIEDGEKPTFFEEVQTENGIQLIYKKNLKKK